MVGVVRLDEAVLRKLVAAAGIQKVLECAERARLVLQKVDDFERGTGLIEVVEPGGMACGGEALVDALVLLVPVEDIHADLAERGAVVGEGAIAERGTGDGGEPAIEDGKFCCQTW